MVRSMPALANAVLHATGFAAGTNICRLEAFATGKLSHARNGPPQAQTRPGA